MLKKIVLMILVILTFIEVQGRLKGKVVVMGSSVASGWVTSYKTKYDMKNGWAYRLERLLLSEGFELHNISVPGENTKAVLQRIDKDLIQLKPDYVIISLSLSNEGIMKANKDSVLNSFHSNLLSIIQKCEENKIIPIIGYCYPNDEFTEVEYSYLNKMNSIINRMKYASINFSGSIDDGKGNIVSGFTYDEGHPDNRGHEEMFYSIPTIIFNSGYNKNLSLNKSMGIKVGKGFKYVPNNVMHGFTLSIDVDKKHIGAVFYINDYFGNSVKVAITDNGIIFNDKEYNYINKNNFINIILTNNYLLEEIKLYINGEIIATTNLKIMPISFDFNEIAKVNIRNLLINRAPLNNREVVSLANGELQKGSLEVFVPFIKNKHNVLSLESNLTFSKEEYDGKSISLIKKIKSSEAERESEPRIVEKTPAKINTDVYKKYVGIYNFQPGLDVTVYVNNEILMIRDFDGNEFKLLPETEERFFIKHPISEFIIEFVTNKDSLAEQMIFNINGQAIPLKRIK